jgi:serine/threonine protein phosphatase PrpC
MTTVGQKRVRDEVELPNKKLKTTPPEEKLWNNFYNKALKKTDPAILPSLKPGQAVPLQLDAFIAEEKGKRDHMEDARFICQTESGSLMGIFDGHGDKGALSRQAANYFQMTLPPLLKPQTTDLKKVFKESAIKFQNNLPVKSGGTTAVMAYFNAVSNNLYVASLGDSELKVFRKIEGKIYAIPVSIKRDWSSEKDIERAKKAFNNEELFQTWLKTDKVKLRYFPPKIGVNVSRAFGDKKMTIEGREAISCHPHVCVMQLKKDDLVVMACDGVWDFVTDEDLIKEIMTPNWECADLIPQNVANYVLNKGGSDNITIICAKAVPPHPESPLNATIPFDENSQETQ